MKITYLSCSTLPSRTANSVHVMKMCQAFKENEHDITLVALKPNRGIDLNANELWGHYGISVPFRIKRMRRLRVLKMYDFNFRSAVYAKKYKSEIVYARNLGAATLTAEKGITTIFEWHMPILKQRRMQSEFKRLVAAPGFRRLVVITNALRNHFLEEYASILQPNQVIVAPDAVDLERFYNLPEPSPARKEIGINNGFTVGYAGHLYKGRGVEIILAMAKQLPSVQFYIIGGMQTDIDARITEVKRLGLTNIIFAGFINNEILPIHLAACDVLLMPYQKYVCVHGGSIDTAKWASPMKMFEYMATRRLIVSSELPVLKEILNTGNSILCSPEDTEQWTATIKKAQENKQWANKLALKAFNDVQSYTWKQRVQLVLEGVTPVEGS